MRRLVLLLALFPILLTGCAPALTVIPAASETPVLAAIEPATPAPTKTLIPTSTPAPETLSPGTPTITPLPTIPTFTPTFDVRTIVTATPAPKAECPKEDDSVWVNLKAFDPFGVYEESQLAAQRSAQLLDLLNQGLKTSSLLTELKNKQFEYLYIDFTGDGVKDVLLKDLRRFHIFYCAGGSYKLFTENRFYEPYDLPTIKIVDLNKDGLPEIIARDFVYGLLGQLIYMIDGWNGKNFVDLALENPEWEVGINNVHPKKLELELKDVNRDGLEELFFTSLGPWREDPLARDGIMVFSWNGKNYVYNDSYSRLAEPQYRFQAIQDGDGEVLSGRYTQALAFYQETIFSDTLAWWSPELEAYEKELYPFRDQQTPPAPTPFPDVTEYPRLAAYAYYRMVILHTFLGEMDAAQVKYATLQEKFPVGNPGHPYAEMATDFWNAYQSSGKMYNACAAAIAYTDAHPDILTPLGDFYHGWQSYTYVPADVCPFR
jgi:hypothetical protein